MIDKSESLRGFFGFRCSCYGPKIAHLFYADDSLLFTKASLEEFIEIQRILEVYSLASGQLINFHKSDVCFSSRISAIRKFEMVGLLGMVEVVSHDSY